MNSTCYLILHLQVHLSGSTSQATQQKPVDDSHPNQECKCTKDRTQPKLGFGVNCALHSRLEQKGQFVCYSKKSTSHMEFWEAKANAAPSS